MVIDASQKQAGGLSIVLGIALMGLSLISYLRGVEEVIAFLAISVSALVFGVRMLQRAHGKSSLIFKIEDLSFCPPSKSIDRKSEGCQIKQLIKTALAWQVFAGKLRPI